MFIDPIEQSLLCLSQTLCVWLAMYKHRCVPCSDGRMHNYMPSRCGRCTCAVSVTRVMQYLVQLVGFGAGCSYSEVCRPHGTSASGTLEYTTTCALRFEPAAFGGPRFSFAAFRFAADAPSHFCLVSTPCGCISRGRPAPRCELARSLFIDRYRGNLAAISGLIVAGYFHEHRKRHVPNLPVRRQRADASAR